MAIAAGDTSGIISVPIINPVDREPTETFFVNLSNLRPGGGPVAFSKSQGIGTINDNDYRLTVTKIGAAQMDTVISPPASALCPERAGVQD